MEDAKPERVSPFPEDTEDWKGTVTDAGPAAPPTTEGPPQATGGQKAVTPKRLVPTESLEELNRLLRERLPPRAGVPRRDR